MPIFNPKPEHVYVGQISSLRKNRYEEDQDLYFDSKTVEFFIVESSEFESGPNVTCNHSIQPLDTQSLESTLRQHEELRPMAQQLLNEHRANDR